VKASLLNPGKSKQAIEGLVEPPAIAYVRDPSPIDFAGFSEILGSEDREEQIAFVREFVTYAPGIMEELEGALGERDREALLASAHGACGSAKYVGAVRLAETFFSIEKIAATAGWDEVSSMIETSKAQMADIEALVGQSKPGS
jgi:HPt (histidine-containing phosphotransfer) domain-containing protein